MPRNHLRTRSVTLHRLPRLGADDMIDAIDAERADSMGADVTPLDIAGMPAVWIDGCLSSDEAPEWCADASATTGLDIGHRDQLSGGMLLVSVDQRVYAIGYGREGHRLLLDEYKDQRFGLSFAVRALDASLLHELERRFPSAQGRTDITHVPAGLPITSFGLGPAEIVRSLGGLMADVDLAFCRETKRAVRIEGSAGLRLRLGVLPDDLVTDIRTVAEVCASQPPAPALEFIDHIQPVHEAALLRELDAALEELLDRGLDEAGEHLAPVVPSTCLRHIADTHSYLLRIPSRRAHTFDHLDLEVFLERLEHHQLGQRVQALRKGRLHLCADGNGKDRLAGAMAIKWLEASWSLGDRRFHLLDGQWYEIGAGYLATVTAHVKEILARVPSLDLPAWKRGWTEQDYNEKVPERRDGYLCLDRQGIPNPFKSSNRIEICDLLGPNDELVHVKQAKGSAPLSHLFNQALVSTQTLAWAPGSSRHFSDLVHERGNRRTLPPDFEPKKVVLAILLKHGQSLTAGSLFPFSQVTLAHTATTLQKQHKAELEVISIPQSA